MTKEDRDLFLKDLCIRLPYEVRVTWDGKHSLTVTPYIYCAIIKENKLPKLLLRSLSSMTEKEKKEYQAFFNYDGVEYPEKYIDWLNAHYFDYRGLIDKGLVLEAKEGMYNINNK